MNKWHNILKSKFYDKWIKYVINLTYYKCIFINVIINVNFTEEIYFHNLLINYVSITFFLY